MDLLNPELPLNISDPLWRIYSRSKSKMPHFTDRNAEVNNSMITEGSEIFGKLDFCMIFSDVRLGAGSKAQYSAIMDNVKIGEGVNISYAIIAGDAVIEDGATIGMPPEDYHNRENWGIAVIGQGAVIKAGCSVMPGQMIEPHSVYEGRAAE